MSVILISSCLIGNESNPFFGFVFSLSLWFSNFALCWLRCERARIPLGKEGFFFFLGKRGFALCMFSLKDRKTYSIRKRGGFVFGLFYKVKEISFF